MKSLLRESSIAWVETEYNVDRVFALLGVATDSQQLGIRVDYSVPFEELCTQLMAAYVRQGDLWFLHYCQTSFRSRPSTLPYWVPNWSQGYRGSRICRFRTAPVNCVAEIQVDSLPGLPRIDSNGRLRLEGVIVDNITWVFSERYEMKLDERLGPKRRELFNWIRGIVRACSHDQRTMCMLLISNAENLPSPAEHIAVTSREEQQETLDRAFDSILEQDYTRDQALGAVIDSYIVCLMQATGWRCVFRTKNGRLGLALAGIQRRQRMMVSPALSTAFVVESVVAPATDTPHYRIICEAYVHDLMENSTFRAGAILDEIVLE